METSNLNIDLHLIERDLKLFIEKYPDFEIEWGRMQNDVDDKYTEPYAVYSFDDFKRKWRYCQDKKKVRYALMRWIRYWCGKIDENILCEKYAKPNPNPLDKKWDIVFDNVGKCPNVHFDVKSTRFPKTGENTVIYWKKNPVELIKWFYRFQTKESRYGYQNRLFVVHNVDLDQNEMKIRMDFDRKRILFDKYFKSIINGEHIPYELTMKSERFISDIIFV